MYKGSFVPESFSAFAVVFFFMITTLAKVRPQQPLFSYIAAIHVAIRSYNLNLKFREDDSLT
jgi:hypothetical protein